MSNLSKIKSKAQFIASLNPKAWDAVYPHSPIVINDYLVELFVADTVKVIAKDIENKDLQKHGIELSKKIASKATNRMLASWDEDDGICPPWPWPWPGPLGWMTLAETDLLPKLKTKLLEQSELVSTLVSLSALTMEKEFNVELKGLATNIARNISNAFADEVERCGTVPRKPWGGGRRPVAKTSPETVTT